MSLEFRANSHVLILSSWVFLTIFQWACATCRSAGQQGDGLRVLPFPPPRAVLRSHCTLHSRTSKSPSEHTSACPDSLRCCTQKCRNNMAALHKLFNRAHFFSQHLVTCSYISSFHHSSKHPGSLFPSRNNTGPRPSGCFYMVINWWLVRVSAQLWTAQGKVNSCGGHSLICLTWRVHEGQAAFNLSQPVIAEQGRGEVKTISSAAP